MEAVFSQVVVLVSPPLCWPRPLMRPSAAPVRPVGKPPEPQLRPLPDRQPVSSAPGPRQAAAGGPRSDRPRAPTADRQHPAAQHLPGSLHPELVRLHLCQEQSQRECSSRAARGQGARSGSEIIPEPGRFRPGPPWTCFHSSYSSNRFPGFLAEGRSSEG